MLARDAHRGFGRGVVVEKGSRGNVKKKRSCFPHCGKQLRDARGRGYFGGMSGIAPRGGGGGVGAGTGGIGSRVGASGVTGASGTVGIGGTTGPGVPPGELAGAEGFASCAALSTWLPITVAVFLRNSD